MTDKEVGEIWEWCVKVNPIDGKVDNREVADLIRKLVEERAEHHNTSGYMKTGKSEPMHYCRIQALYDFGIDSEGWKP